MPTYNFDRVRYVLGQSRQSDSVGSVGLYLKNRDRRTSPSLDSRPKMFPVCFYPTSRIYSRTRTFEGIVRIYDGISPHTGTMNYHDEASITSRWNVLPTNVTWYDPPNHKILAEIKGQKINLGMVLAEYRETSRMFVDGVSRLASLYRDIRRGRVGKILAKGSAKGISSQWLLYRYGVTPLISDLKGSLEQLSENRDKALLYRFRTQSSMMSDIPHGESPYPAPYNKPIRVLEKITVKDTVWVEYDSITLRNFSAIGLLNPVQLAWEVIPFSFVADWFINVGDYLASLDALTGVSRTAYTRTFKVRSSWTWPTGGIGSHDVYNRSVRKLTPTPPTWEPSLSWKRIVDSVALVANLRR